MRHQEITHQIEALNAIPFHAGLKSLRMIAALLDEPLSRIRYITHRYLVESVGWFGSTKLYSETGLADIKLRISALHTRSSVL